MCFAKVVYIREGAMRASRLSEYEQNERKSESGIYDKNNKNRNL